MHRTRSRKHRWTISTDPSNSKTIRQTAIAHLDLQTGQRQLYELTGGDLTSEPVFVPRSADAPEGDGWLTAVVWRAAENRSDLLIFEALDLAKGPIATANMPRRMPFGFHGNWANLD